MYLNEAFDIFNRVAGIRSTKKVTGPEIEKLFKKLERTLTKYYNIGEQTLEQQKDLIGGTLKSFEGTRFKNLPHVQEMQKNYESTIKALAAVKQLKSNFASAKGKAYDFQFNSDKQGAMNLQSLEDGIKNIMSKTVANVQAVDDDMAKAAGVKQPEVSPEVIPDKEIPSAQGDSKVDNKTPDNVAPETTAPVKKDVAKIKDDAETQKSITYLFDKYISKNSGLVAESIIDEAAVSSVPLESLLSPENMKKYTGVVFKSADQRKRFNKELRDLLNNLGYQVSGISHPKKETQAPAKPEPVAAKPEPVAAKPEPVAPTKVTPPAPVVTTAKPEATASPISNEVLNRVKQNREFENLKINMEKYREADNMAKTAKNKDIQAENAKLASNLRGNVLRFQQMIPELKSLNIKELENILTK